MQPFAGQLADVYGRRSPLISSVTLFALGSGIAGGASNVAMLIAGRTIQGLGAGGIYVLIDIVCCDLVPLRERGKWLGLMFSWSGVGAALGSPVGGALAEADWRWIFLMNIPICAVALAGLMLLMRVNSGTASAQHRGFVAKLRRLDILGNAIFIPSMIALLIGLVEGGNVHAWSSWRIILPLVLGSLGWIAFHIQQFFASFPSVPPWLFSNRTSATAYFLAFTSSMLIQAPAYFLPIYFQAVLGTTALQSGTYFLPFALGMLVFAAGAGVLLAKIGAYRPLHAFAFALIAIAFGLFTRMSNSTSKVAWVFFELIGSVGTGFTLSTLLPTIMAPLADADTAVSSATYSFVRCFVSLPFHWSVLDLWPDSVTDRFQGYIWGVTLPSIIFNAVVNRNLDIIADTAVKVQLSNGAAYSFASQMHRIKEGGRLPPGAIGQIDEVYTRGLKAIWWVCLGISIISFFAVGLERGLELRKELSTEYGLDEMKQTPRDAEASGDAAEKS